MKKKIKQEAKNIFDAVKILLAKSQGVTRLSADQMSSKHLIESSRQTAQAAIKFLDSCKEDKSDPKTKRLIEDSGSGVTTCIRDVVANLKAIFPDHPIEDFTGGDAESIHQKADKSLAITSKAIEEATKLLLTIRVPPRRIPKENSNVVDFTDLSEGILKTAKIVADSTGLLIKAATTVQGERKNAKTPANRYHNNPQWGKGLISAAHTVGASINMLVSVCDKSIKAEIEEEALIASANQVNAATAQLVAASNVRIDPNSASIRQLAETAKKVANSTQELITVAQQAADFVEEQRQKEEASQFTMTESKVRALEQQMKIIRLENELSRARQGLLGINKEEYDKK